MTTSLFHSTEAHNGNTDLTPKISQDFCEMIEDGKTPEEIRKACNIQANTFRYWIMQAVLLPVHELESPLLMLRNAIISRALKDTALLGMLKAAEQPSEKTSRKSVILTGLSKHDKALLEHEGHEAFIEKAKDTIVLKVEETVETIPPQTNLYKDILKAIGDGEVESSQKIIPFSPPHPDLEPV